MFWGGGPGSSLRRESGLGPRAKVREDYREPPEARKPGHPGQSRSKRDFEELQNSLLEPGLLGSPGVGVLSFSVQPRGVIFGGVVWSLLTCFSWPSCAHFPRRPLVSLLPVLGRHAPLRLPFIFGVGGRRRQPTKFRI